MKLATDDRQAPPGRRARTHAQTDGQPDNIMLPSGVARIRLSNFVINSIIQRHFFSDVDCSIS